MDLHRISGIRDLNSGSYLNPSSSGLFMHGMYIHALPICNVVHAESSESSVRSEIRIIMTMNDIGVSWYGNIKIMHIMDPALQI